MDYISFFKKLQEADARVKFTKTDESLHCRDLDLPVFYQMVNPVDVEFEFNDGIVKLASFENLSILRETYQYITEGCVFAVCNGDPIYVRDGGIYTCIHGTNRIVEEKIADSVEMLFEQVMKTL